MQIAARQSFLTGRAGPTPWVNPYITDGLVAMWDGEWNAGGGVHDANATTWVDLSPTGADLTIESPSVGNLAWGDNRLYTVKFGTVPAYTDVAVPIPLTIEVVVAITFDSNAATLLHSKNWYYRGIAIGTTSQPNIRFGSGSSGGNGVNLSSPAPVAAYSATFASASTSNIAPNAIYVNGAVATRDASGWSGNAATPNAHQLYLIGKERWRTLRGSLYCIRLYSRALIAAEVAANCAIDAQRFGISA